jgi:adhesin transport system outer membrane protein
MKKIYLAALFLTSLSLTSVANADAPFTLQQLIEKTVTSNPEVQARYHNFKAAEQEQNAARGGYYPRADLVATVRSQEQMTPNINNTATPNSQTQLVLRQMLFDGFATRSEVSRLGHAARVRYYELQSAMQNTALETVKAYIDVQRYRQLAGYAQDNYVAHKQLFDRIEERVTAGVARRVDLEQASGRLALAEANLLTESTNLQNVTARYQRLTGELPPSGLPEVEFFKAGVAPTATEALQYAYQKNPDILSAIENIVATQQEVESKRAKYYPRLDLLARKNLQTSSNGENSIVAADLLELTATFNLFNGFTDKSVISQTAEKLNTSQDLRDKACVDTRQSLVIAYNDVSSLKEQLGYRDQHQLSIEKAREAYRKQFDIGQRTLLDLLDTENEYFQARRTYTNTERDLYTAFARTYASQGELLSKLDVTRADLPDMAQADYVDNYKVCKAVAPDVLQIDKADLVAKAKPLNSGISEKMAATPVKPVPPELPKKVVPDVQFETNSAKIKKISYPVLDNAITTVKAWGTAKVEVGGHTDKRDSSKEDYNLDLSNRRAQAVSDYLVSKGIDSNRLTVRGYGYSKPIAENDPKNGNLVNRRVELVRQ